MGSFLQVFPAKPSTPSLFTVSLSLYIKVKVKVTPKQNRKTQGVEV
jgi:hypothetical protein